MRISKSGLKAFLDEQVDRFNRPEFIDNDPISIPHRFSKKEDIEISGFLAALISWGNRKSIINNASKLTGLMDNSPHDFIINAGEKDYKRFESFVHRTFNSGDCIFFIHRLSMIYKENYGLEAFFCNGNGDNPGIMDMISRFKRAFFSIDHLTRTEKHLSDPGKGSAAKRINMFLRWMVRNDNRGVDFGIWKSLKPSQLYCPLDVHSGNTARKLGLITRKQNDRKAVEELTAHLREFDAEDPVKYDFALFGSGIYEDFRDIHNNR